MEMSAAQLSELRRPDAVASRPILLSIDKVGFSVPAGNGKLTILEDLSLEVREGEFVSIIGGSGCGKTTLLRLIGGSICQRRERLRSTARSSTGLRENGPSFSGLHQGVVAVADRRREHQAGARLRKLRRRTRMPPRSIGFCNRSGFRMRRIGFRDSFPAACSSGCRSRAASHWNRKCF